MTKKEALEQLLSALVETGAEFSCKAEEVVVGGLTFNFREEVLTVSMEQAKNFFRYATLCYISGYRGRLHIADTHPGVFSSYEMR